MPEREISIRLAHWHEDNSALRQIRRRVFIEEQSVPESMEWDEYDDSCDHFLVTSDNRAIACARLITVSSDEAVGRLGRMAVLAEFRHHGTGSQLLQAILSHAGSLQLKSILLHAQLSAVPFYERAGFLICSEVFYEAGIAHREMRKDLC